MLHTMDKDKLRSLKQQITFQVKKHILHEVKNKWRTGVTQKNTFPHLLLMQYRKKVLKLLT